MPKTTSTASFSKALKRLSNAASGKVPRALIGKAIRLVVKDAKSRVKAKRSGQLKKSLGSKVKTYRNTKKTVGIAGPRRKFKITYQGKLIDPAKYAHLVEGGRVSVTAKKARVLSDGTKVYGRKVKQVEAQPFLRPALENNESKIKEILGSGFADELLKEARK